MQSKLDRTNHEISGNEREKCLQNACDEIIMCQFGCNERVNWRFEDSILNKPRFKTIVPALPSLEVGCAGSSVHQWNILFGGGLTFWLSTDTHAHTPTRFGPRECKQTCEVWAIMEARRRLCAKPWSTRKPTNFLSDFGSFLFKVRLVSLKAHQDNEWNGSRIYECLRTPSMYHLRRYRSFTHAAAEQMRNTFQRQLRCAHSTSMWWYVVDVHTHWTVRRQITTMATVDRRPTCFSHHFHSTHILTDRSYRLWNVALLLELLLRLLLLFICLFVVPCLRISCCCCRFSVFVYST